MTRKEVADKLRELADEIENAAGGSLASWEDFELDVVRVLGRPGEGIDSFVPVYLWELDWTLLRFGESIQMLPHGLPRGPDVEP